MGGVHVDRLVCHPVLPLVAAEESRNVFRSAVHMWDCGGQLRELGTVSAQDLGRSRLDFAIAWEPDGSLLLAANYEITGAAGPAGGTVARWTPAGVTGLDGLPPTDGYTYMEFSPDGRAGGGPTRQPY